MHGWHRMLAKPNVFFVILILVLGIGGAAIAAESTNNPKSRFAAAARARDVTEDHVVLTVGNDPVMLHDFREAVAIATGNIQFMDSEIEKHGDAAAPVKARLELIQQTGVEAVAMASLIEDLGLYQAAQSSGIIVATEEVANDVATTRAAVESGSAPQLKAYIDVIGEERYWSSVYPPLVERNRAIQQLWSNTVAGMEPAEARRTWNAFKQGTVRAAAISIEDPASVAPATLESAMDYLTGLYTLPE